MNIADLVLPPQGRVEILGTPEGQDARALAALVRGRPQGLLIHVAVDDARMSRLRAAVGFFDPDIDVLAFPAWDCLPYDRVSPNPDLISRRIDVLTRLRTARSDDRPRLLLTTVNAATQLVPGPEVFADAVVEIRIGGSVDLDALLLFFARNGYARAQTVREPGEFALRGGIVDVFPPGTEEPARLDLFGDEVERIRLFDPVTQRSTGQLESISLKPMSELFLDPESIQRFRGSYRELFGAVVGEDPLYEAVSEGRRHGGMEHWLPLFHTAMVPVVDYLPDAPVSLDHHTDEACDVRFAQIGEFHDARVTLRQAGRRSDAPVYKPLPPERLYLDRDRWNDTLAPRVTAVLSPYAATADGEGTLTTGARRGRNFADVRANPDTNLMDAVSDHVARVLDSGKRVIIAGYSGGIRDRIRHLLEEHSTLALETVEVWPEVEVLDRRVAALAILPLESGFESPDLVVISEQDIFGDRLSRTTGRRRKAEDFISEVSQLNPGDLVVHGEHGIGRYDGLETLTVSGAAHDCLRVTYTGNDKLFVPVENIEILSRFGQSDGSVALDKLGSAGWQARKARVKKRLRDMAEALLRIAAERELHRVDPMNAPESIYEEFAARFPYAETDDQTRAIEDVLGDLENGKPMDRLICGDVGFGKTEVALRAALVAAFGGGQVAVIVPTTLLARQHYLTFTQRFSGMPIRLGRLSRLVSAQEAKQTRQGLADGSIDVVVGTHALLSKTVSFANLSLVVVDEEQHFGVKQKERLKNLRTSVHVLTMTATPIPRTLQLALTGVRDLSLIATPPVDRLAVRTFVLPYDPVVIREAMLREHFRGGQTYYVCPRIEDLEKVRERLVELIPEIKITVAHGRMPPSQIEDVMAAFYDGQFDVLLSTSIVESGLDVPTANTLVVHRADLFGLSQLYQLRGRIGRSKQRAYAYFTYDPRKLLSATQQQRLHVIGTLDSLGAGFSLASHDMDIRGAGNLLGEEQSGHIREVGVELYQQMLRDAVSAARSGVPEGDQGDGPDEWVPTINLGMPVLIPEAYVADLHVRLDLYRRIARLVDPGETDLFAAELIDRFGAVPREVENLLTLVTLKQLCKTTGVEKLEAGPKGAVITFRDNTFAHPDRLVAFISRKSGTIRVRPDHRLVFVQAWDNAERRIRGVKKLMEALAALAA